MSEQNSHQLIVEAMQGIGVGITVIDASLTLVLCNNAFLELCDFPVEFSKPGTPFEALMRYNAERGECGPGDVDELVRERVERAKLFEPHRFERRRPNGRTLTIEGKPLPSGGFMTSYAPSSAATDLEQISDVTADQLLRAVEKSTEGLQLWDTEDRLVYMNPAMKMMLDSIDVTLTFGKTFEENLRLRVDEGKAEDAKAAPEEYIKWRLGLHLSGDRHFQMQFGENRWFNVIDQRLPDGASITRFYDISELKRAERELQISEQRLIDFASTSADNYWETDAEYRLVYLIGNANERESSLEPKGMGQTLWDRLGIDIEASPKWKAQLEALDRRESFRDFRFAFTKKDGEIEHWRASAIPIFDQNGDFKGYRGTSVDETEAQRLQAEEQRKLQAALQKAEVANRSKSLFLATMSHELRTPLNAIIGFSDLISSQIFGELGDERYVEYVNDIQDSGQHLLALIEDVLDLSRAEMGQVRLHEKAIDPKVEIAKAVSIAVAKKDGKGAPVLTNTDNVPSALHADERLFRQILINLIVNAVKFPPQHGRIFVDSSIDADGEFLLRVRDTGIGIAAGDLEKILKPFEQADNSLSRPYEGVGLGLPLTKSFVELHSGTLSIKSEPQVGTTVTIRFPKERVLAATPAEGTSNTA